MELSPLFPVSFIYSCTIFLEVMCLAMNRMKLKVYDFSSGKATHFVETGLEKKIDTSFIVSAIVKILKNRCLSQATLFRDEVLGITD